MTCTDCGDSDVVITGAGAVTVAGSGTPTDPYVISEAAQNASAPNFQVRSSSTVSLTLYGTGTTFDPYVLRADTGAAATLRGLSDVASSPAVSQGAVPMWIGAPASGNFQFNYPGTRYTTSSTRGTGRYVGEVARDTDTGNRWEWDGGTWVTLNPSQPTFTLDASVLQNAGTIDSTVDWNSLTARSGIYRVSNGITSSNNTPSGAYGYGTLEVVISGQSVTQRYSTHVTNLVYVRTKWNASDWTSWSTGTTSSSSGSSGTLALVTGTAGAASNTAVIQNALNAAYAAGGGTVSLPAGTYYTNTLHLRSYVILRGQGAATVLTLAPQANADMFNLYDGQTEQTGIENIRLDGNKANQTISNSVIGSVVRYDNSNYVNNYTNTSGLPSLGDPNHFMNRVLITNAHLHGIWLSGPLGQMRYDHVLVYSCDGNSFRIEAADSQFTNCISSRSGLEGFYVAAPSLHFVNCKSFLAGNVNNNNGDGYYFAYSQRTDMVSCEAQDNWRHGFNLVNVIQCRLDIRGDRNGISYNYGAGVQGSHLAASNSTQCIITLVAGDRDAYYGGTITTHYAYELGSGNDGNIVQVNSTTNRAGTVGTGSWGGNSTVVQKYNGAAA